VSAILEIADTLVKCKVERPDNHSHCFVFSTVFQNQGWNKLKLFFDGDNFVGGLEDPTGVNRPSVQATRLRGE